MTAPRSELPPPPDLKYRLGHEIRTPLTVVIGASELLLESKLDAQQRLTAQSIQRSGQELLRIIDQLVNDLSDSGKSSPPAIGSLSPLAPPGLGLPVADRRILLAEDNEFNRVLIERALAQLGCKIDTVRSGREALKRFSSGVYDLILMDCHMPGMDGLEATREIRKLEQETQHVPIVAVTTSGLGISKRRCLAAGMDDFIAKPFSLAKLREKVRRWLLAGLRKYPISTTTADVTPGYPTTLPVSSELQKAVDFSRLDELALESGSPQIVVELAHIFLHDVARRLDELRLAHQAQNLKELMELTHSIKGACANFGALFMARTAEALERKFRNREIGDTQPLIQELFTHFNLVRAELEVRIPSIAV